jgi:dTDP-4-dehydrorhamnose 3,5-epimerase
VKFIETAIRGAYLVRIERAPDERGFFARTWCAQEFAAHGLSARLEQCSVSYNARRGTLRGMHYQAAPHAEAKLVRCTSGAIYDVIVDARAGSAALGKHVGVELARGADTMLYVPEGVAHGFITLADDTEVSYLISVAYEPRAQRGFRWDDPALGIRWPLAPSSISARDASLPLFAARDA